MQRPLVHDDVVKVGIDERAAVAVVRPAERNCVRAPGDGGDGDGVAVRVAVDVDLQRSRFASDGHVLPFAQFQRGVANRAELAATPDTRAVLDVVLHPQGEPVPAAAARVADDVFQPGVGNGPHVDPRGRGEVGKGDSIWIIERIAHADELAGRAVQAQGVLPIDHLPVAIRLHVQQVGVFPQPAEIVELLPRRAQARCERPHYAVPELGVQAIVVRAIVGPADMDWRAG